MDILSCAQQPKHCEHPKCGVQTVQEAVVVCHFCSPHSIVTPLTCMGIGQPSAPCQMLQALQGVVCLCGGMAWGGYAAHPPWLSSRTG